MARPTTAAGNYIRSAGTTVYTALIAGRYCTGTLRHVVVLSYRDAKGQSTPPDWGLILAMCGLYCLFVCVFVPQSGRVYLQHYCTLTAAALQCIHYTTHSVRMIAALH